MVLREDENILITSYGPFKDRIVTNAVSYTMLAYSIFYKLLDEKLYLKNKIQKMMNFIISVQREDGSWLYGPYDNKSFIDCFHSVFVLKNMIKTNKNINLVFNENSINLGYKYLKNNFFDNNHNLFKRFSLSNKPSLVKFDLYDNAEMLYLSKLLDDFSLVKLLEDSIKKNFIKNNDIYSIKELFGINKNKNTLRWSVMPYILAKSI